MRIMLPCVAALASITVGVAALAQSNDVSPIYGIRLPEGYRDWKLVPETRGAGEPNPPLVYTVGGRGLVNGDSLAGALATSATAGSAAGSYPITPGSLAASANHTLTYLRTDLTVLPSPVVPPPPVPVIATPDAAQLARRSPRFVSMRRPASRYRRS